MSQIPDELRYSEDHLWVRVDDSTLALVGVTDYAQDSLGDVVSISLPEVGQALSAGQAFGEIESTKSISDLISPLDGQVKARNDALIDSPELTNSDPYGQGWIAQVEVTSATLPSQLSTLMDPSAYRRLLGE